MALDIRIGFDWEIGGIQLDLATVAQILQGIHEFGTVRAASDKLGLSYRNVWGKLEAAEASLGKQLVVKSKGHGSTLTSAGVHLRILAENLTRNIEESSRLEREVFEKALGDIFLTESRNLNLACSHDLVIEDCVQSGLLLNWSIRYMGSQKAIDALCTGKADMAGFHLSEKMAGQSELKALWRNPCYFVTPIMCRDLGLVVARGNPLKIRGIEDLVRPEMRFINRQKAAGTRLRLEEILQSKGIDPKSIRSYSKEEFTHSAVTLAVAAGAADVAFTLRAAIRDLDVDFVPIGCETYCFCGRIELTADTRYKEMLRNISDHMKIYPGYSKPSSVSKTSKLSMASRLAAISRWVEVRRQKKS